MLNNISIMGRFTRDPELRRTGKGIAVVSFSLANDEDYEKDGVRETDFIDFVAWDATAEFIAKYFFKGDLCGVVGRLKTRKWTDKEGNERRSAYVRVGSIYFAGYKKPKIDAPKLEQEPSCSYSGQATSTDFEMLSDTDMQLPF